MYLADAVGYLASVGLMLGKNSIFPSGGSFLSFFTHLCGWIFAFALGALLPAYAFYVRTLPREQPAVAPVAVLPSVLAGE